MRTYKLRPVSIQQIKATEFDWEVSQNFLRLGKYNVTVYAHGFSRQDALKQFEIELGYAENYREWDLIGDWCGWLYDLAGVIDSVSKIIREL